MTNSVTPGTPATLTFESTTFDVVTRDNQPWLRVHQIGEALGYQNPDRSLTNLFNANAAEFTDSMTALVKLETNGGMQDVRCFSLRGAHLLGMFARTEKAKDFRKWVLDILDAHVAQLPQSADETLIPSEAQTLKELVDKRCAGVPADMQRKVRGEIWSRVQHKFRVNKYDLILRTQLSDVIAYIMGMEVRAIGKTETPTPTITLPEAPPAHTAEKLSASDMLNIQRFLNYTTRNLNQQRSWTNAIWYYLRKATDTPTPQPFTVDKLPRLCAELHYIASVLTTVQSSILELEKTVASKVFRKGETADLLVADLTRLAAVNAASLKEETAALPNWMQRDFAAIGMRAPAYLTHYNTEEQPGYFKAA